MRLPTLRKGTQSESLTCSVVHPPPSPSWPDGTTSDNGKRSENFGRKAMGLKPLIIIWSWLPGYRTGKTSESWWRKVLGL